MKIIYVKIKGMTCDHCKSKITAVLLKINNINKVSFDGDIAEVSYNKSINKEILIKAIIDLEYYTDSSMISDNKKKLKRNISISQFIGILISFILVATLLNSLFKVNIFNMIPVINSNITLAMLFVTGLLTSIHCVSMCGAINLVASTSKNKDLKKPILYNLGRLTSYTIIGGVVGLIGSVFKLSPTFQGIIILIAALIMLLMALNMMGLINFSIKFKPLNKFKNSNSYVIGLLNGFMPCGPLQAMQIYALSTGSILYGALSMFIFCLGTIPLMLFVGILSNVLSNKGRNIINKISTVLILILSLSMLNRGLLSLGLDVTDAFKPNYDNYIISEIKDGIQTVEFDLSYNGYADIIVQEDIPLKIIINAEGMYLSGCNNSLIFRDFNITKDLVYGENIIEFTPTEPGTYTYTCWMNMIKNKMIVVNNLEDFK